MVLKTFTFIVLIFSSYNTLAQENANVSPCTPLKWPYERSEVDRKFLHNIFTSTPRDTLIQYTFFELHEAPNDEVLMPLLHYLGTTEKNIDLKSFYESMGYIASKQRATPLIAMESWPKRTKIYPLKNGQKQLCQLFTESLKKGAP